MHTLKFNSAFGDLPSLHPHIGTDLRTRSIEKALFEGLTRLNTEGIPTPAGAHQIEISPSQTEYIFHLRPHYWSNGEKVVASDYEKTWKMALTPGSPCQGSEYFYIIKNGEQAKRGEISIEEVGIRVVDESTLCVELENPAPYFLTLTASALFSPLYQGEKEEPTAFNGPFVIADWQKDQKLTFAANPTYWDKENVELKAIEIFMVRDERVALDMYEQGQTNWVGDPFSPLPKDAIADLEAKSRIQKKEIARVCLLHLNTRQFPLGSKKVRQALDCAIDRQQLCQHILLGQLPHASAVPYPYSLLTQAQNQVGGREELARRLFEEALEELKMTKGDFPLLTFTYYQEAFSKLAQYLQEKWESVLGIKIKLQALEWNVLFADLNRHQFQLSACFQTNFFNDPIYNLDMYEHADEQMNWWGWENKDYQVLLHQARTSTDENTRVHLLRQAEEMLLDERPTIPLSTQTLLYMAHDEIEQLVITDLGYVEFKYTRFKKPATIR